MRCLQFARRGPVRVARRLLAERRELTDCAHLLGLGLQTITHRSTSTNGQLFAMLANMPANRLAVVGHHRIPTFHTEHCVYSPSAQQRARFPFVWAAMRTAPGEPA
jgi:hypothetical protein